DEIDEVSVRRPGDRLREHTCDVRRDQIAQKLSVRVVKIDAKGRARFVGSAVKRQHSSFIGRNDGAEQCFIFSFSRKISSDGTKLFEWIVGVDLRRGYIRREPVG